MESLLISPKQYAYQAILIASENLFNLIDMHKKYGIEWRSTCHYGSNFKLELSDCFHQYEFNQTPEKTFIVVSGEVISLSKEELAAFAKLINEAYEFSKPEPRSGGGTHIIM